jgi:ribosomal 30S subunit maturation factor RimM
MPANAVMVVRGEQERWLPVTREHLKSIDTEARCVRVDWPEDF